MHIIITDKKLMPEKGLKSVCLDCGREIIAKCGQVKIHHWAHVRSKDFDPWSEPETKWHKDWKEQFPLEFREICFTNEQTGEIHRADVHTRQGVTLEFQNSPISTEELKSREAFYPKLIWIVNANKFNINFTRRIPNPESPILKDFSMDGSLHVFYFKNTEFAQKTGDEDRLYGFGCVELKGLELSIIHWAFEWKNKHHVWLNTTVPTFLDIGSDCLFQLKERKQERCRFWYLEAVSKLKFISKYSS